MIISIVLVLASMPPPSAAGPEAGPTAKTADLPSVARVPLMDRELSPQKNVKTVKAARIDFRAGQQTGKHIHPVTTMGIVLGGEIRLQIDGGPVQLLKAGDAFFEPADTAVLRFENASTSDPASFAAFYLLGPEDKEIIREAR